MSSATPKEQPVAVNDTNMARLSAPANETPKADRKSSRFREIFKHRPGSSASSSPATLTKSPPHAESPPPSSPALRPGFQQVGLLPSERSSQSLERLDELEVSRDEKTGSSAVKPSFAKAMPESVFHKVERDMQTASATPNVCYGLGDGGPHPTDLGPPTLARLREEHSVKKKGSFAQSMKSALSRHPMKKADDAVAITEDAMGEDMTPQIMSDEQKRSSLPLGSSHKIAEAMYHKNNSSTTDLSINGHDSSSILPDNHGSTENVESIKNPTFEPYKSSDTKDKDDVPEVGRVTQPVQLSVETANRHGNDTTLPEEDARSSGRKSFASNIFDDDNSLSQGIREYVTSKIAEGLAGYDRTHASESDATASRPLHLTLKVDATGLAKEKKTIVLDVVDAKTDLFTGASTIGPLEITNATLAKDSQLVVMAIYAVALLSAAFLGPKTLLLTVWKMSIVLGIYAALLRQLDWTGNVERDVFLAPVFFAASVASGMGEQLLDQMRVVIVTILVEVMERVTQGTGVQMRYE